MPFIDNDPSYKELYDKGIPLELVDDDIKSKYSFYEHTPYSNKPEYEWINNNFNKHYIFMLNLGIEIMQHIAVTIGKEKYYFDNWFKKNSLSRLRSIHYKPRDK
jgi:isopenicillin N synthase-like dioxygenase